MSETSADEMPADSDIDLHAPAQRFEYLRAPRSTLAAISIGGAIGAIIRWAVGTAFPAPAAGFPWATFVINVSGCALIGVLMILVAEVFTRQRLMRPFVGVGVLGGYTTFSTYAVDIQRLIAGGAGGVGLLYLASTVVGALVAVSAGMIATRLAIRVVPRGTETPDDT